MPRLLLIFSFLCGCSCFSFSTIPALEREITLRLNNEPLNSALNKIQEQAGIVFSYPSSILNNMTPVSLQLKQKTVREALSLLLPKNITYKAKNNYIILKEKPAEKTAGKTELNGYVYDKNTDKKVANVTLYDKKTLQTVTTDAYGYYAISLPKEEQCLTVNKENYRDTCVALTYLLDSALTNIRIDPLDATARRKDSLDWKEKFKSFSQVTNRVFRRFKGYVNTINVKDTITRNFQLSLIPYLGTNGLLSGNVYNQISLNVFGGYSRGTKALEMGGFFNIDRENVRGAQLAGFFNVVGDSIRGAGLAGFMNVTGKHAKGVQAAGCFNINLGGGRGFQGAGLGNVNANNYFGCSATGIFNFDRKSFKGVQMAGITNIVADTLEGASLAGLINISGLAKRSVQIAGAVNIANHGNHNIQLAGGLNSTRKGSSDLQVGSINRTRTLTGMQVGILNIADSASGIPIGLLSLVKKGVHEVELSSDELFYANLSFRSGVNSFYNILSTGILSGQHARLWNFGYGIGTSVKIRKKLRADATAGMYHVSNGKFYFATSELYKFYIGLEYKFTPHFSLTAGPTFNLYWTDALLPDYKNTYSKIAPYYSFDTQLANDFNLKGWLGARIALRFL